MRIESEMDRLTIDDLEMLNPVELGELLLTEVRKESPDVQFIQDLIAVGCPIDARDNNDRTVLHLAARYGHLEVVKFLLSRGMNVDMESDMGLVPLHFAVSGGHLEMLKFLISKGADIHARDNNGWTALHRAADFMIILIIEYLLSIGADVNAKTVMGYTPWDYADVKTRNSCPELEPK